VCRHQPRAPNPSCNKDLPSHPQQMMGETSLPTPTTPTLLARAINLPRLETASASPPLMPLSSPSLLPFKLVRSASTNSGGDSFHPSTTVSYSLHRGSIHDKSGALVVFVGVMALRPPIHRSLIADADIGHEPPTNPLGLSRGGAGNLFLVVSDSISPDSGFFGRQFSWLKFLLFVFHFWFFQLIVRWCMVFPLHLSSRLSFGSLHPSSCFLHFHFGYSI
jgi:hypothetical protein